MSASGPEVAVVARGRAVGPSACLVPPCSVEERLWLYGNFLLILGSMLVLIAYLCEHLSAVFCLS